MTTTIHVLGKLTARQRQVLETIAELMVQDGAAPTMREVMAILDLSNTNALWCFLQALRCKGWLEPKQPTSEARALRLTPAALDLLGRVQTTPSGRVRLLLPGGGVEMSAHEARELGNELLKAGFGVEGG